MRLALGSVMDSMGGCAVTETGEVTAGREGELGASGTSSAPARSVARMV